MLGLSKREEAAESAGWGVKPWTGRGLAEFTEFLSRN
jgi:hypothetical protein